MDTVVLNVNTTLGRIREIFPDIEKLLCNMSHSSVARLINTLSNSNNLTIGYLARAAGLTELEISLLIGELNDRLEPYFPRNEGHMKKQGRKAA